MNDLFKNAQIYSNRSHLTDEKPVYSHIIEYEPNEPHRHEYVEFFYVFNGACVHSLNGEQKHISTGYSCFMMPSDVHQYLRATAPHFLHRDIIVTLDFFKQCCEYFDPALFENLTSGKYHLEFSLSIEQMTRIESFIPWLNDTLDDSNYHLAAKALTSLIITFILEHNLQKAHNYPTWLTRLLSMLNAHENLSVDLTKILSHFAYSKEYLRRSFRKHLGMTMTDYFNKQKMAYAYSLLQNTSYSIESICEMIGITNVSYFYQLFKKHFDTTPHSIRDAKKP